MYIISQKKEKILQICRIFKVTLFSQGSNVIGAPEEGSAELQNKLIIKYGTYTHSNGEYAEIFYFPTPFPHKCVSIVGSPDTYDHELNWSFIKRDRTSFYMYMDNGGHYTFSWIAIGY